MDKIGVSITRIEERGVTSVQELCEENESLRQQLAQAHAVIAKKDEALKWAFNNLDERTIDINEVKLRLKAKYVDALAIQPSSNVLDEYVMSRLEMVKNCFYNDYGGATLTSSNNHGQPPLYRLKDK